jgi:arylsulfatase
VGADQRGAGKLPVYQAIDDERRPAVYRTRYEAEVRFFDRELGRLVEHLRASGLLERALVVFTADHGESLGERGFYFSHGQHLHRELVHVPLLLRPPGGAVERRVPMAPVSHLDVAPTVLAFRGGVGGPPRGLAPRAAPPPPDRTLPQFLRGAWGATDGAHRLIVSDGRARLYAIDSDPEEEHDLAQSMPELVRALSERHHAFAGAGGPPIAAARPAEDDGDAAGMRALGYTGDEDEDED